MDTLTGKKLAWKRFKEQIEKDDSIDNIYIIDDRRDFFEQSKEIFEGSKKKITFLFYGEDLKKLDEILALL